MASKVSIMDQDFIKGEFVLIETLSDEMFEGYFFSQNIEKTRLSLYNVMQRPKGDILDLFHFSVSEIKSVQRFENDEVTPQLEKIKFPPDTLLPSTQSKFIFINQMDNRMEEALHDLRKHKFLGVGTEGAELGRKCKLSLLTISTPTQIYIFDVQAMQEAAFDSGIRQILESNAITKIIHNSRKLSDCLLHKHGVELQKVFDIQAADIILRKRKNDQFPSEVKTLKECLKSYLRVSEQITEKVDIVELAKRPVMPSIKEALALNIVSMHQLYDAIMEEIMMPYIRGFEYYLNCQRQCSDSEAWYVCSQDKKIPKAYGDVIKDV